MKGEDLDLQIEKNYWYFHKKDRGKTIKVEYANDIPVKRLNSGFPTEKEDLYLNHPWNFNVINHAADTLLQFCPEKVF